MTDDGRSMTFSCQPPQLHAESAEERKITINTFVRLKKKQKGLKGQGNAMDRKKLGRKVIKRGTASCIDAQKNKHNSYTRPI